MSYFVQRDSEHVIIGLFRNPQPGYAEEELPENNGEVVAFLNPAPPTNAQVLNASLIQQGSVFRGLALTVLDLAKGTIPVNPAYTTADLLNAITARMG